VGSARGYPAAVSTPVGADPAVVGPYLASVLGDDKWRDVSIGLIAAVITLEARPVYGYLAARFYGTPTSMTEMIVGFGAAAVLCMAATVVPIGIARRRLEAVER